MPFAVILIGLFAACFLLGSVPWGVIISKVFYHTDVREHGSGNIGTTNALRTMGKAGGAAVFVLDFGKGLLAGFFGVWLCQYAGIAQEFGDATCRVLYATTFLGCVWGHIFSPWLHFKGGKGIAVAIGNLFVTFGIPLAILELVIFGVLVAITKKVSVGSVASAAACPIIALYVYWGNWLAWFICSLGALTVVWAHRSNIERLRQGTESEFKMKKE